MLYSDCATFIIAAYVSNFVYLLFYTLLFILQTDTWKSTWRRCVRNRRKGTSSGHCW